MRCALAALAAGFLAGFAANPVTAQDAEAEFSSRYTLLEDCTEVASSISPDYMIHRCEGYGGIPIWWRFADSVRLYIGFGETPHDSGPFGTDRDSDWPIEWRGNENIAPFSSFAVIIRMRVPRGVYEIEPSPALAVFKLREDGTSCLIARDVADNERAREIADSAPSRTCASEPFVHD